VRPVVNQSVYPYVTATSSFSKRLLKAARRNRTVAIDRAFVNHEFVAAGGRYTENPRL
jgi:hypothetical protein